MNGNKTRKYIQNKPAEAQAYVSNGTTGQGVSATDWWKKATGSTASLKGKTGQDAPQTTPKTASGITPTKSITGAQTGLDFSKQYQKSTGKQTTPTGTGTKQTGSATGTGGYAATPPKPVNPYENPESYGPENPYAKILAGIGGQGGGNPYASLVGQGGVNPYAELAGRTGENPYAGMMGQGGVNPYAELAGQGGTNPYLEMMSGAGQYKGTIPEAEAAREGLYGVSEATKRQMDRYGGEWIPGTSTQEAQERYRQMQGQAPGEYSDPYAEQLSQLYEQITGRPGFQYDLNGDMLYKQYAQQYAQMGRQAMQDTMGQAAAMTGGYGSSYASTAGNQAYQGYLQQLNDKIPELYDRALATYQMQGDQMKDQYSMLRDLQDTDYGRYKDELSRYYEDLGLAREDWQQERAFDYGQYGDSQDYWTRMAQLESQDARTSQQYDLQRAQMLTDESRDQRDYLTKLQQMASDEDWKQRDYDLTTRQLQAGWDQDARDYALKLQQLASDEDWKQRDYDLTTRQLQAGWDQDQRDYELSRLDRQTAWDQDWRDYQLGLTDRQTEWDQGQQQQAYQYMMQMLQLGADPSDALKTMSGISPYDIYGLQQALKPQTGTYYGGTGSSTGSGAKSTGTKPTATSTIKPIVPTTTPQPTGQTGTQRSVGTEPEDLYMAGLISEQQLYEMQMRRAYGN